MDFAGLSDERDARSAAPHRSSGGRDRRVRTPHGTAIRPGSGHVHQSGSALTTNRPAGAFDRAAADTADQRQADYFLRLLTQNRRLIEQRIDGYHKAIAVAEARGDAESATVFRRTARIEEQERNALDSLIDNLHRRFPVEPPPELSPIEREPRLVVR
ncbi:hypothetical protein OK015_12955 [Mycobacterium sp. Aquia_216]|uniref:hypothetical protein n=1 Tax=Mycobacterium sp. Aquia_216 TaxID=2991729 RepID=UPI00227B328E|nr:hypothetical protein [Mycobacterium sp. Aquia_216]WAJ47263.1 hypothetical protein OK015_12955 [Mycobacterium sp. Aquia_216]